MTGQDHALCSHCLLPVGRRAMRRSVNGEACAFCCYGCFIAYHLKDMYLGDDVTFFCEHCKDETMFHFDEFSKLIDVAKLDGDE